MNKITDDIRECVCDFYLHSDNCSITTVFILDFYSQKLPQLAEGHLSVMLPVILHPYHHSRLFLSLTYNMHPSGCFDICVNVPRQTVSYCHHDIMAMNDYV